MAVKIIMIPKKSPSKVQTIKKNKGNTPIAKRLPRGK